jgi:galacturan 1,4-alpha-galacturonidase
MTWTLKNTNVDLYGTLNFAPTVEYWLDADNTYRVVFIQVRGRAVLMYKNLLTSGMQNQASWFVVTGSNFVIDAHWQGGIEGNGQV